MSSVANKPSFIDRGVLRFLIVDAPTDANLDAYIKEMKSHNVSDLVRATESHYSSDKVHQQGIRTHDIPFPDGDAPPDAVITKWLNICDQAFAKGNPERKTVAVHCVAGLGRAPVLVAIALIEGGMEALDAVTLIRSRRRGAINAKQLSYLQNQYKKRSKKSGCVVM